MPARLVLQMCWIDSGAITINLEDAMNPSTKKPLQETSNVGPTISANKVAWKGSNNINLNVMDVNNPSTKKIVQGPNGQFETSNLSPALDHPFIAWTGTDNRLNVMDVNNPSTKVTLQETSSFSPSLNKFEIPA